jgi:type IV secretion system protein VirB10
MIAAGFYGSSQPASEADNLAAADVHSAPTVARPASAAEGLGLAVGLIGAAALGGFTILSLAHHKPAPAPRPPAPVLAKAAPPETLPVAHADTASTPPSLAAPSAATPAPVLVVDSTAPAAPTPAVVRSGPPAGAAAAPGKAENYFSQNEQFSAQAAEEGVPTSHIQRIQHPDQVVAQGAVIPAVLETALDSDLPGYARALVSRDVRSFDGSHVLIPRGSRLVGQYKSELQTGQTRMLVIWTRLLRPDGVTIQLGSPTTDESGEAGLTGRVDNHFLQRYGSAFLLTAISGLASVGGAGNNTVVIGTATQGSSVASTALQTDGKIAPTVKIMQGAPIQVFVARDLDFSEDSE